MFRILTPRDPSFYPLRVHDTSFQENETIEEGDILATLELADGRKVRMSSPVSGTIQAAPETGKIYIDRDQIALIAQSDVAEPAPGPEVPEADARKPGDWKADLSREQIDLVEGAYRSAFGAACGVVRHEHPGDRVVRAGIPFAQVLEFEKAAYIRAVGEASTAEDIAVWNSAFDREQARPDGYSMRTLAMGGTEETCIFAIPTFILPIVIRLAEAGKLQRQHLHALEENAKTRPQCFEDAWDYLLPHARALHRICREQPPRFDDLQNKKAAAFGRAELYRIRTKGFTIGGSPSSLLWSAYAPVIKDRLSRDIPEARPVDLHPVDFIARNGKALSSWKRDEALARAKTAIAENEVSDHETLVDYLNAASKKHFQEGELSSRAKLWTRTRYPTIIGVPLLIAAVTIATPHGLDGIFRGIGGGTSMELTPSSGASAAIYQPSSLDAVDNGKRPRPSEATKAAFQTWLEE